ncbi:MAG TPA: hypothetical protein PK990_09580, partial [Salinivirgaceae bacterium]|nr:hypothetical protein [Salinivirgaceae bacterium]
MLRYFRYRRFSKLFSQTEKLLRNEIYRFQNDALKQLIQEGAKKSEVFKNKLERKGIKWYKFRGFAELESISVDENPEVVSPEEYYKTRQVAMSAAFKRVLSWHKCENNKVFWITPNKNRLILSGLTKNVEILDFNNNIEEIAQLLDRTEDFVLAARPAILAQLALFLRQSPKFSIKPKLLVAYNHDITPGGENLLRDIFNVPIARLITDTHFGAILATCQYDYYHLFEPLACYEILDKRGLPVPSGRGRLVVTPLHTNKPQLIPYNTKIEIIANQNSVCACGLTYRTVDSLSYSERPCLSGHNNQNLLIPLSEELHPNIIGINYQQNFPGEVLITLIEYKTGKYTPLQYKEWFSNFWNNSINILIVVDNRPATLGDSSLSNHTITFEASY